jgi:hypothetical protein
MNAAPANELRTLRDTPHRTPLDMSSTTLPKANAMITKSGTGNRFMAAGQRRTGTVWERRCTHAARPAARVRRTKVASASLLVVFALYLTAEPTFWGGVAVGSTIAISHAPVMYFELTLEIFPSMQGPYNPQQERGTRKKASLTGVRCCWSVFSQGPKAKCPPG